MLLGEMLRSRRQVPPFRRRPQTIIADGRLINAASFTSDDPRNLFDANGVLQIDGAAANVARRTYIDGNPYLWMDGEVTEISGRSADFLSWAGTPKATVVKDAVGLDGSDNTAFTVTDDSSTEAEGIQRNVTITNDTADYYTVIMIGKDDSPNSFPDVRADIFGGTPVREVILFNPSDGSYVELVAQGRVVIEPILIGDFWLIVLGVTNNASGNSVSSMLYRPAYNADGSTTLDTSATGSGVLAYYGLFKNNFSLMPILTTGGTTEALDAEDASLTLGSWFNATKGSIPATVWIPVFVANQTIFELRKDGSNYIKLHVNSSGNVVATVADASGTGGTITSTGTLTAATEQKVELVWGSGGYRIHINGSKDGEDATLTVPSGLTTANIGHANNADHLYGGIADLPYIPREETEAQANARTAL